MLWRSRSSSSTSRSFAGLAVEEAVDVAEAPVERLLADRLLQVGERAQLQPRACRLLDAEMTWTGMWRVCGLRFSRSSTREAVQDRQLDVEHDRVGLELVGEREPGVAAERDDALEAVSRADAEHDPRERRVVLDDQEHAIVRR